MLQRFIEDAEEHSQTATLPDDAPPGIQESMQRLSEGEIDDANN
jgi:hypothetical protein